MDSTDAKPGTSGRDQYDANGYLNSAQFHRDRIDDLEAGNIGDLTQHEAHHLIALHRAQLAALLMVN
jgi:hypothetical protein